jgi:hypothetical protein
MFISQLSKDGQAKPMLPNNLTQIYLNIYQYPMFKIGMIDQIMRYLKVTDVSRT